MVKPANSPRAVRSFLVADYQIKSDMELISLWVKGIPPYRYKTVRISHRKVRFAHPTRRADWRRRWQYRQHTGMGDCPASGADPKRPRHES